MTETPMDRETAEEIKRHFNVVAESLRSEIRMVAEGSEGLQERISTVFNNVLEEFDELKSMIRMSFGELDRSTGALEDDGSSLSSPAREG